MKTELIQDIQNHLNTQPNQRDTVYIIFRDGTKEKMRLFNSTRGNLCVFDRGSKKRGRDISHFSYYPDIVDFQTVQKRHKTEQEKWYNSLVKAIGMLESSGFNPRLLEMMREALGMGLEKAKKSENNEIAWHLSQPLQIKKMRFDANADRNTDAFRQINEGIEKGERVYVSGQTSYDVSFSYYPDVRTATYSEEFRGLGNGHYYLALSPTHAVFWEDD